MNHYTMAQQAITECEELIIEASAGDRHKEHYAFALQQQAQLAQLHLLAVIAEATQTIAAMTTEKATHHHQIERLQEWLQANQEWLQANSLYQSFDGDAADLMIALVERQRYELVQLKKLLDETIEQLTLIDADNAMLLRKLRTLQEQEDA